MIKDYHQEHVNAPISILCRILEVSRSGYYKWLNYKPSDSEVTNTQLKELILRFHYEHKGILGYRRMTRFVNRTLGTRFNPKRIRRIMQELGIRSVIRRVRHSCTKSSDQHIEENILNRDFCASKPNEKWCTDVTFMTYGAGQKAYLSVIKDLFDGSIVAYHVSKFNNNPLVMNTLHKAMAQNVGATPLLHSDRGSQYTSKEYHVMTNGYHITRSMSRVGKCLDNAPVESFFGHFKTECYDFKKYSTFNELVTDIEKYIEFYNYHRYQEKYNGLTPHEMRNNSAA